MKVAIKDLCFFKFRDIPMKVEYNILHRIKMYFFYIFTNKIKCISSYYIFKLLVCYQESGFINLLISGEMSKELFSGL